MNRFLRPAFSSACATGLWALLLWQSVSRKPFPLPITRATRISAAMALSRENHPAAPPAPLPGIRFTWAGDFAQGLAPVRVGEKFGYIDTSGVQRIPAAYAFASGFSENRAACLRDGKWGYLDVTGREVITPAYASAGMFSEGLAVVTGEGGYGFIDSNGTAVGGMRFTDARPFSQGLAAVRMQYDDGEAWGFMDKRGVVVIPPLFPDVPGGFSEGVAMVRVESEMPYRSGFIDSSGGFAIDTLYDAAGDFHEGLAPVGRGQWRGNRFQGLWGYVDRSGRPVIPPAFSEAGAFREGKALIRKPAGGYAWIGKSGNVISTFRPDLRVFRPAEGEVVTFAVRETFGFLDSLGRRLSRTPFAEAGPFREGRARVRLITVGEPIWGYIDEHGRYVGGENKTGSVPSP
jgi:WG containing repeat